MRTPRKGFSNRRGRPRATRPVIDKGTPELYAKRQACLTTEPIDLLYQQGFINAHEQWCALHFRWLYALRFGRPSLQALDLSDRHRATPATSESSPWLIARQQEYRIAAQALEAEGVLVVTLRVLVFSDTASLGQNMLHQLKTGLACLSGLWGKSHSGGDSSIAPSFCEKSIDRSCAYE